MLNVPKHVKNQVFRQQGLKLPILKLGIPRRHARESLGPLATRGGCPVAEKWCPAQQLCGSSLFNRELTHQNELPPFLLLMTPIRTLIQHLYDPPYTCNDQRGSIFIINSSVLQCCKLWSLKFCNNPNLGACMVIILVFLINL